MNKNMIAFFFTSFFLADFITLLIYYIHDMAYNVISEMGLTMILFVVLFFVGQWIIIIEREKENEVEK